MINFSSNKHPNNIISLIRLIRLINFIKLFPSNRHLSSPIQFARDTLINNVYNYKYIGIY